MAETLQKPQQTQKPPINALPETVVKKPVEVVDVEREAQFDVQHRMGEIVLNELEIIMDEAGIKLDGFSQNLNDYTPTDRRRIKNASRWIMDRHPGTVEVANIQQT